VIPTEADYGPVPSHFFNPDHGSPSPLQLDRKGGEFGYQCRYCGVTGTDEVCVRAHEENCNRGDKS
jgi:hypothetical protein